MCALLPLLYIPFILIYLLCGIGNFYYWQCVFRNNKTSISNKRLVRIIIRLSWILLWPIWLIISILIGIFSLLENAFKDLIK